MKDKNSEEQILKFGVDSKGEDILVRYKETENGHSLRGTRPFGGLPMPFLPVPEGYIGVKQVQAAPSLAHIVDAEESSVFRMGNTPTAYYQYIDGVCCEFYGIKKIEEDPQPTEEEQKEIALRQLLRNTIDVMTYEQLLSLEEKLNFSKEFENND